MRAYVRVHELTIGLGDTDLPVTVSNILSSVYGQYAVAYRRSRFRDYMINRVKGEFFVPATSYFEYIGTKWLLQDYKKSSVNAVVQCRSNVHARQLKLKTLKLYVETLDTVSNSVLTNHDPSVREKFKLLEGILNGITLDVPE